jgi:hypothetical protein
MDYKKIVVPLIKYNKTQLFYNNDKVLVELPIMKCKSGIEKYFNKYQLILKIDDEEFLKFINSLETNNRKYCRKDSIYKSNVNTYNNRNSLILKVPYRYNRLEVNIKSDRIYLPTIEDISPGMELRCKMFVPKIWNYNTNDKIMSGSIMEVKEIYIV